MRLKDAPPFIGCGFVETAVGGGEEMFSGQ